MVTCPSGLVSRCPEVEFAGLEGVLGGCWRAILGGRAHMQDGKAEGLQGCVITRLRDRKLASSCRPGAVSDLPTVAVSLAISRQRSHGITIAPFP